MAKQRPTRRQLEVLRAYIRAGSVAAAAHELGIGETTVRQHLSGPIGGPGCVNAAQAAYWLGRGDPRDIWSDMLCSGPSPSADARPETTPSR